MPISSFWVRPGLTKLDGVQSLGFFVTGTSTMVNDLNAGGPGCPLPTLQRNALRKIFDRHEFSPEEVALLGYRRLQQAEGIGSKGLLAIAAWLAAYGFELKPPEENPAARAVVPRKQRRSIEQAVRLLRHHGYEVLPKAPRDEPP